MQSLVTSWSQWISSSSWQWRSVTLQILFQVSFLPTASPKLLPWVPLLRVLRLRTKTKYRDAIVVIRSTPLLGLVVVGEVMKTTLLYLPYMHSEWRPCSSHITPVESFLSVMLWYGDKMTVKKARHWWGKATCTYTYHFAWRAGMWK